MTRLCDDFDSCYMPVTETGCWIWLYSTNEKGYGRINIKHGSPMGAHRFSYQKYVGPIPEGMFVCHKCDTPLCVNPSHLFLGTPKENSLDCSKKMRRHTDLRPETVLLMRRDRFDGLSYAEIARRYGCTISRALAVCRGRAWAWVGGADVHDKAKQRVSVRSNTGERCIYLTRTGKYAVRIRKLHIGTYDNLRLSLEARDKHERIMGFGEAAE